MAKDPAFVKSVLSAIDRRDGEAIESLRGRKVDDNLEAILATWRASLPWEVKDLFVWLFMDQKDARLEPMMLDAIESPNPDTRAPAICYLVGSDTLHNTFLAAGGWIDPVRVDAAIAKWKNETGRSESRACGRCGAPHRQNDLRCRFCQAPLQTEAEDPGCFRVGNATFEIRVGVPAPSGLPSDLQVQNAIKRGRAAMRVVAISGGLPASVAKVVVFECKGGRPSGVAFECSARGSEGVLYASWDAPKAGEYEVVVSTNDVVLARALFRVVL